MRSTVCALVLMTLGSVALAADPAKAGRLAVGVTTVVAVDTSRGRSLPTEIWYPAKTAGRDTTPLSHAYPLILMAHGFCGSRTNYEYLTTHLASHGFLVAAPSFVGLTQIDCDPGPATGSRNDWPFDLSFVCRTLHDVTGPLARWATHVRSIPTGLVGHSLGGWAAVEAAKLDPSFTTVAALAPAELGPDPEAAHRGDLAYLVMGGTADTLVSFSAYTQPFFDGLEAPKFLVRISEGTHSGFSDEDSHLTPAALAAQQAVTKRETTAFFVRYLAHKAKFKRWLRTSDDGSVAVTAEP